MSIRFWGVRGSIACPGARYVRYGGNTSCIEVRCGEHLVILDGGTGMRELGEDLSRLPGRQADILLTHTHMDHIGGVPFFMPLFDPAWRFRLFAGHLAPRRSLKQTLIDFMGDPVFPVPPSVFSAQVEYVDFHAGESFTLRDGIQVRTACLNHPQRATGYRIEHGGKSFCYITDTEHVQGKRDQAIVDLVRDADIMVYDSTYTDEQFPAHVTWGHSTWEEGVRIADEAGVKRLALFHHDPGHDDDTMDVIAEAADRMRPGTLTSREGMRLDL